MSTTLATSLDPGTTRWIGRSMFSFTQARFIDTTGCRTKRIGIFQRPHLKASITAGSSEMHITAQNSSRTFSDKFQDFTRFRTTEQSVSNLSPIDLAVRVSVYAARLTFKTLSRSIVRGDTRLTTGLFPASELMNSTIGFDAIFADYHRVRFGEDLL